MKRTTQGDCGRPVHRGFAAHRSRRTGPAAALAAVAGPGLAGCSTEGPEAGTDVDDVTEGQVVEVTGTVQQAFDLPTIEDEKQQDLEDELCADHDQQPYIDATDVRLLPEE